MAATVRSPGARIAPLKSTLAHSHTRSLKTASKWRNTCIIPFGRVSIFSFSFARILREAYSVFPFLSSDWIKSTPGRAYFQIGAEIFELFQSARTTLPARISDIPSLDPAQMIEETTD